MSQRQWGRRQLGPNPPVGSPAERETATLESASHEKYGDSRLENLILDYGALALILLGLTLGLRHGIDWDHIVAIADITGSMVGAHEAPGRRSKTGPHSEAGARLAGATAVRPTQARRGFLLASLYALGHAALVVTLGLLAIWAGAILPDWVDPLMERVVGVTLLALGLWIIYSLWRHGSDFQLRSRWMLAFWLAGRAWAILKSKLTGKPAADVSVVRQYGPKAAFGIGMIHGVGAETGSQALLLATVAGATTGFQGTLMLISFTLGLLLANSLVAVFSVVSFVSASLKRNVYVAIGAVAGVFSLIVGLLFVLGQGAELPDLQQVFGAIFGASA